ncbi:MAG: hypothetical protein WD029_10240 [Microthrixaceae bacterium]
MSQTVTRLSVFFLGVFISCIAYCVTVRAGIGLGPLFLVQVAFERLVGVSAGVAATLIGLLLVVLSALLRGGVGPGTVLAPVLGGVIIDLALPLIPSVQGTALQIISCAVATAVMMLGAALITHADFGVGGMDGVMRGLANRLGVRHGSVRLAMEASLLLIGLSLGSRAGIGTVITALLVGHCYQFWMYLLSQPRQKCLVAEESPAQLSTPQQEELANAF